VSLARILGFARTTRKSAVCACPLADRPSLHSTLGAEPTNGDGFGIGWYDDQPMPGVFRSIEPAWNDQNLRELAGHVTSGHFFAHIRAAIGSAVQQTNCHPFRHGRWLFMHNGFSPTSRRSSATSCSQSTNRYPDIAGQADTELLFYLALTFGLEDDPPDAVARAIGLVEAVGHQKGVKYPFQGTIATTDGERMWVFRYSSEGKSRSLFFSGHLPTLRELYPKRHMLQDRPADQARRAVGALQRGEVTAPPRSGEPFPLPTEGIGIAGGHPVVGVSAVVRGPRPRSFPRRRRVRRASLGSGR
jgi:predicted glutamine amidotransferase